MKAFVKEVLFWIAMFVGAFVLALALNAIGVHTQ